MKKNCSTIDEYILSFSPPVQLLLNKVRSSIKEVAPQADETINYGMPTFKYYGNLVHFAAYEKHIGFYPAPDGIQAFIKEIDGKYVWSKGAIQFPIDKPIPFTLIKNITKFRLKQNEEKMKLKAKRK